MDSRQMISMFERNKYKKIILPVLAILAVVVIFEVFVFNFRHWLTIGNTPLQVTTWTASDNTSISDVDAFKVENIETPVYIDISGLDMPVNLIGFDIFDKAKGETAVFELLYHLEITDQGNSIPYSLPQRSYFWLEPKMHFSPVNPYGNVHSIRMYFDNVEEGAVLKIPSFVINPKYILAISKKRMMALFICLIVLYMIRPTSALYQYRFCDKNKWKNPVITLFALVEILLLISAVNLNKFYDNVPEGGNTQFMQLTEAIVDRGEVFLAAKAPEGMADMEDPYDAVLRRSLYGEMSDVGDMSDTGFYQGRYFVYFGIAPILVFYIPFYMITGTHIATRTVVIIECILNVIGALFLFYQICRKYFKELPFAIYLLSTALFTFGAGQMFLTINPDFYSVPIWFAFVCIQFGLGFWIKALSEDESKIKIACMAIGSLCMALPAASRPQFLIASFLAIVLFFNAVFKERTLFSKKSIGSSIAFTLPYIMIASLVMYYNYIRFGNVFDFGANYNLCYNNMPYRGVHIDRLLHATAGYLFYPCTVTNRFPFFELSSYVSGYPGISADETLFGGIIYNNLYLLIVFFIFKIKKVIKEKEAFLMAIIAPAFSIIVAVVDANMAGVLPRYYMDFTWGFMISAFILLGYLYVSGGIGISLSDKDISRDTASIIRNRSQYIIRFVFYILFIMTFVRLFLMPFKGTAIYENNMKTFFRIKNLVEFWY